MSPEVRGPAGGPRTEKSLRLQILHTPSYRPKESRTSLIADVTLTPNPALAHRMILIGRGGHEMASNKRFVDAPRAVICINNDEMSRQTLAVGWAPERGLVLQRLSDHKGIRVHYREWGHNSVSELKGHAPDLSPRTVVQLGELGFWLRTLTEGDFTNSSPSRNGRNRDPNATRTQGALPGLQGFQEKFSCTVAWLDADHTLLEECGAEGHGEARANLAWLVSAALPFTAWPPGGWIPPTEIHRTTILTRVRNFDRTNLNTTKAQRKPLTAVHDFSLEANLATLADALQRILQEHWLPHSYILRASQIIHNDGPVNWSELGRPAPSQDPPTPPEHRQHALVWLLAPGVTTLEAGTRVS